MRRDEARQKIAKTQTFANEVQERRCAEGVPCHGRQAMHIRTRDRYPPERRAFRPLRRRCLSTHATGVHTGNVGPS